MAFTNTWDNNFPPDTQAANQLGQDLRNFRTDTQERMAAMSGPDASKPGLEVGFAGMIYIATDTGKIYIYGGSSWTEITPTVLSNISANNATLQAGIVAAIAGIPATAPGPLVLPTASAGVTATVGDNSTLLATTAFVLANVLQAKPVVSGAAGAFVIKFPTAYDSTGTPTANLIIQLFNGPSIAGSTAVTNETVNYPTAFPTACLGVTCSTQWASYTTNTGVNWEIVGMPGLTSCNVTNTKQGGFTDSTLTNAVILAFGY